MANNVTYRQQFTRCGKQRCHKCKDGAGHGPYWYAFWSVNGRTVSKYIGKYLPEKIEIEQNAHNLQRRSSPTEKTKANAYLSKHQKQNKSYVERPFITRISPSSIENEFQKKQPLLRIYTFGQFRIEIQKGNDWYILTNRLWRRRRARALLACLLSASGRRLGREQAMEALWPDLDSDIAANRLNGAVHEVRQILEPDLIKPAMSQLLRLEHDVLQLADVNQIWIDADEFEELLDRATITTNPLQAEHILEEAARLYEGDYLLEELYSDWTASRRESLQRGWISLLLKLAELRASRGAFIRAIEPLERLLATHSTNETAVRRLMILLTQLDRRGEALQLYQRLKLNLKRDFESEPLPETQELFEVVRQGYPYLQHPIAIETSPDQGASTPQDKTTSSTTPGSSKLNEHALQLLSHPIMQLGRQNQSPLIGRDQELARLRQYLVNLEEISGEATQRDTYNGSDQYAKRSMIDIVPQQKNCHFLLLMGESGIGKTRLAEELSVEAHQRGWSVAWAHAYELESVIPYRPWIDVLRTFLQSYMQDSENLFLDEPSVSIAENTTKRDISSSGSNFKLARLKALLPELASNAQIQSSSTSPLPPEQERLYMWEATLSLLRNHSISTPLLLVLDDLHWVDKSSLEMLAFLIRHLQENRILIIGTCRDVELPTNSILSTLISDLRREQLIDQISVIPLNQDQIGSLVAYLPPDIVRSIQKHAGGNPFFAEELARISENSPLFQGVESQNNPIISHYQLFGEEFQVALNHGFTLPQTIAAVLERRLSKLSSDCQLLLGKAAILGGSFEFNQLLLMTSNQGMNEETVLDLIEEALRAGLLTEEGTGTHIIYHFWHPLIVSHLYENMSAARRSHFHRKAAKALLQLHHGHEVDVAGAITYHLFKGSSEVTEIARYAEIAGNRAFSLPAYSEAEHYYRLAIEALENQNNGTSSESSEYLLHLAYLFEQVAECNMVKGDFTEARELYKKVLDLRKQRQIKMKTKAQTQEEIQHEAQLQALIWRSIGRTWSETGDYTPAQQCCDYGKQIMLEAGITSGAAWACLHLLEGNIYWKEGDYDNARAYAQEALEMLKNIIEKHQSKSFASQALHLSRQFPENIEIQSRMNRSLIGDPLEIGRCHEILGITSASIGHYAEALKHLENARVIFEEHGLVTALTQVYGNLGAVYGFKAENDAARTYLQHALELADRISDFPNMAFAIGNLADIAARCGNLQEAVEWFKRSILLAERVNDREQLCWNHVALASTLLDRGDMRAALEHIRHSLAIGRAMQSTRDIGFALIALGNWRVAKATAHFNIEVTQPKEQTIYQNPACHRLILSAKAALERALALEGLDAEVLIEGHLSLAFIYYLLQKLDIAQQKALQTLEQAHERELTRLQGRSQRLLGLIFAAQNQYEQATTHFNKALDIFDTYDMRLDHARTLNAFGIFLLRCHGQKHEVFSRVFIYFTEAYEKYKACGADIDRDQVQRVIENLEEQFVEPRK